MPNLNSVLDRLHTLADPEKLPAMRRFALTGDARLGISIPDLRALATELGKDHALALELWRTAIPEAQILATLIADPKQVTSSRMDDWARAITAWDICDAACNNLFVRTPFAWDKVHQWAEEEPEFTRRAGFVLIACLATHDKKAPDGRFIDTFPLITAYATDPRNFVKKAVNWALRGIGKRNLPLNRAAIDLAHNLNTADDPAARWIASDALRELTSQKVQQRLREKAAKK